MVPDRGILASCLPTTETANFTGARDPDRRMLCRAGAKKDSGRGRVATASQVRSEDVWKRLCIKNHASAKLWKG